MKTNPLKMLGRLGQSVWMDFISRELIKSGQLQRLIDEDGICGVTTNPTIFEKSISSSRDYDETITKLIRQERTANEIIMELMAEDVRSAADIFKPVFERLNGRDGFVSIEVSPHLAYETNATIEEARRLWKDVNRPNIFIKVPATMEGLAAIRQLISEGINVNITLLFGLPRYTQIAEAYINGLEDRVNAGKPVDNIASVASFFLSRIDTMIDPMLEKVIGDKKQLAEDMEGMAAIASAKGAYHLYQDIFSDARFKKLAQKGARTQRLLWASTSTKNPAYGDVKYVEPLIGPDTVNTMPPETITAYRDHGNPALRIEEDAEKTHVIFQKLKSCGIDIDEITERLEKEGVEKFIKPFDELKKAIKQKIQTSHAGAAR